MKKGKLSLSVLLFVILLSMTGCGKDNPIHSFDRQQAAEGMEETVSRNVLHFPMLEQYESATIAGGKIYACCYGERGMEVCVYAADTMEQTDSYGIPDMTEVKSISVDASEQICIFGSTENGDALWKISPNGEISTIEDIEVEELGSWPQLKNFYADSNGFYYLWYEMGVPSNEVYEDGEEGVYTSLDRIYVKDQQMKTIIYEQVPGSRNNRLVSLFFDEDGIPMMLAKNEDWYYMQRVRTEDREEYEPSRLEMDIDEFYDLETSGIIAYTQNGLLYTKDGSLHLYHISDSRDEKLLELAGAGIFEEDIIYLGMRGSTIEIIDNYKGFEQSEYTVVEEGEPQRTRLTLGVMMLDSNMRKLIAEYNRYQNEVTIEPIVYMEGYNYKAGLEKLKMEVIQGKAPDLMDVSGLGYESLAKAGAFVDLYTLMQKDAGVDAEDFVSSVLKAYEVDGQLYTIAPAFMIHTMWGSGSMIEGQKGIRLEEMIQMLKKNGGDINSIYGFSADESVLTTLCTYNMDRFIDWDDGTCDFTGKEFQQVVNFAKEYEELPRGSIYEDIQSGDILLTIGMIACVEDYRIQSEMYGEKIQFVGCPTEKGSGSAVAFLGDEIAINSKSKYQEEAWEFIKYFMQKGYDNSGFPVAKEQYEAFLDESLNEDVIMDENGKKSRIAKKSYSERNKDPIYVYKCEPEDVEVIRDLVDSVSVKFQYNLDIQKIIDEEVGAYLQDQKSMEDVCAIIQNRVQLYLDERQ